MAKSDIPLYDITFLFRGDNPFKDDPTRAKLRQLHNYIEENQEEFTDVNYITDSRYVSILDDTEELFGEAIDSPDIGNNPLNNYIKNFLMDIATIGDGLSKELSEWAAGAVPVIVGGSNISTFEREESISDNYDNYINTNYQQIPILPRKFTAPTGVVTNYDITSDKAISYEDLRKLTVNIARSKLIPEQVKDETVIALENEKRKQLIQEISRYRNVRVIAALDDSDLTVMSLPQLEQCLEQCKQYHDNFKIQEMCKRGISTATIAYDAIFPDGIPLGKKKRVKFNGVGKEILSTLFDGRTPVGLSFSNILQKHNIHISDEILILTAFAGVIASKISLEDVKPKDEDDNEEEDDDKSSVMSSVDDDLESVVDVSD